MLTLLSPHYNSNNSFEVLFVACRASLRSVEIGLFPNSEEKLVADVIQDCCAQLMSRFPPPFFWITLQLDSKKKIDRHYHI